MVNLLVNQQHSAGTAGEVRLTRAVDFHGCRTVCPCVFVQQVDDNSRNCSFRQLHSHVPLVGQKSCKIFNLPNLSNFDLVSVLLHPSLLPSSEDIFIFRFLIWA